MRKWVVLIGICGFALSAQASDFTRGVPQAALVGQGTLTALFWDVYDAKLYAPKARYQPHKPAMLVIDYRLDLDGVDIADRTVEEIRNQGFTDARRLSNWRAQLVKLFPDVKEGDELAALFMPAQGKTRFFRNGNYIGTMMDAEFTRRFADIWLGSKSSEPELRDQLLGRAQ